MQTWDPLGMFPSLIHANEWMDRILMFVGVIDLLMLFLARGIVILFPPQYWAFFRYYCTLRLDTRLHRVKDGYESCTVACMLSSPAELLLFKVRLKLTFLPRAVSLLVGELVFWKQGVTGLSAHLMQTLRSLRHL